MRNVLAMRFFSENMMKGKLVLASKYDDKQWYFIKTGSLGETSWKLACGKK
jgi:hypothetical protein